AGWITGLVGVGVIGAALANPFLICLEDTGCTTVTSTPPRQGSAPESTPELATPSESDFSASEISSVKPCRGFTSVTPASAVV
ncbi:hypothetical protein, partial [Tessaracoccus sp.]